MFFKSFSDLDPDALASANLSFMDIKDVFENLTFFSAFATASVARLSARLASAAAFCALAKASLDVLNCALAAVTACFCSTIGSTTTGAGGVAGVVVDVVEVGGTAVVVVAAKAG